MAARESMRLLIDRLRSVTAADPNEEYNGIRFWSDTQLQAELDKYRQDLTARLQAVPAKENGVTVYKQYAFSLPRGFWVEDAFVIQDADGFVVGSAYGVEIQHDRGIVTFAQDVGPRTLTITFSAFDWNAAAADVWEQKAAHRYDYITVKVGDSRFDANQEYQHCLQRMQWHRARRVKAFSRGRRGFVPAGVTRVRR